MIRKEVNHGIKFATNNISYTHFINQHLAFKLTNAQEKVLREISSDLYSGKQKKLTLRPISPSASDIMKHSSIRYPSSFSFQ